MKKLSDSEILRLVAEHGSMNAAARSIGMPRSTFREQVMQARNKIEGKQTEITCEDNSTTGRVLTIQSKTVRSLDEVLAISEVDLNVWEVERWVANKWDVVAKTSTEKVSATRWENELTATEAWQVKVWLRRRIPKPVSDAITSMLANHHYEPITYDILPLTDRHLLELSFYDVHFGKLCWGRETGRDYDLKLSKTFFRRGVDKLLSRVAGYPIDRILIPIGNDFFHINSWKNTTAAGTPLDVDSRMSKIFEVGCEAMIEAINRCIQIAPVDLLWVPGNHDPETSWYMAKCLDAWYRTVDEVRVNAEPNHRKYIQYGCTLLGYTHGHAEKHDDLPTLMAVEQPQMWANSSTRSWRLGHFHTKRQKRYTAGDTFKGVTVDVLPSISGADAWHYQQGYVGNPQAAEAWLWSFDEGYVGQFSASV